MNDKRQSLSHAGGPVDAEGDKDIVSIIAPAMANALPDDHDILTHGFHSYAAKMHPLIARGVIEGLSSADDRIVDPFCGSGTVLVEAMRAGLNASGNDLNPLATRLSKVKCQLRDQKSRQGFTNTLQEIALLSTERVQERRPIRAQLSKNEIQWYAPHVVKELAGLYEEIQKVKDPRDKLAFQMLFSSIIVKFSKQRSDTSEHMVEKRIRKGLCTEFFERKGLELEQRWESLREQAPDRAREPTVLSGDIRNLGEKLNKAFDLVITSPPYGGTYNYADHHRRRFAWLGLKSENFRNAEIGARRANHKGGARRWNEELLQVLKSCHGLMTKKAKLILVLGDGQIGQRRINADEQVRMLIKNMGLVWLATASQMRPDWTGRAPRAEHVIVLGL